MRAATSTQKPLSILCATSVANGGEAFASLGHVTLMPEADIDNASLRGMDALVTRSKVKVNDDLLEGCSLRFYGTATAGADHVDAASLAARGIAWSEAAGCNANSVAEYVVASLAWLGLRRGLSWRDCTIAIIGAGHVGSRLGELAAALGLRVRFCDPPLAESTGDASRYEPLAAVLAEADVVSLHVPLTDTGPHPTRGMVNHAFFEAMKPGAVFINSSRGEVVADETELLARRADGRFGGLILDVFHHEPAILPDLVEGADLATPHIAGYSLDGRLAGTQMIYEAACRHFGCEPVWRMPVTAAPQTLAVKTTGNGPDDLLFSTILAAYNPSDDYAHLKEGGAEPAKLAAHFRHLRARYPDRREFRHFAADLTFDSRLGLLGFAGRRA
jgi:erythronate-4-phosphate dehydrogenase